MGTLNDTLAQQLCHIRTQKEISIEAIAKELGMSPDSYAKVEKGETPITLDNVEGIAKVLEVSVSELLNTSSLLVGHRNINAEMSPAFGGAYNSSPHSNNAIYIGVSSEVLEKLLQRIDTLESGLASSRKQQ